MSKRGLTLTPRGAIIGILWLQIAIALFLFGGDISRELPRMFTGSTDVPPLTQPVAPGDQTRRYEPADWPTSPGNNPSRPFPAVDDMPSRLLFTPAEVDGQQVAAVTGAIRAGDAARFAEWLAGLETKPVRLYLNSPGGSVSDALAIGRAIREAEIETAISAGDICLSACPYVLSGGTARQVSEGGAVGVHQHYFDANTVLPAFVAVEDIQRGQAMVVDYLSEMGIDLRLMRHSLATPPNDIYILLPDELTEYALATEILP